MSKVAGVDVLLKIKKNSSFVALGGQKGCSLSRSAETISVTDKNSEGWAESMVGVKSWSLECDGFVVLGDEALTELHNAFDNRTPIDVEIRVGGAETATGYTYTGKVVITDFPEEFAQDDAVTYSLSLAGASKLTRTVGAAALSVSAAKVK